MAMMAMTTNNSMSVNPTDILSCERKPPDGDTAAGFLWLLKISCGFLKVFDAIGGKVLGVNSVGKAKLGVHFALCLHAFLKT